MAAKFEVKTTADDRFMFNLKAANGQVILTSQTYATRQGALEGIDSVRRHAAENSNYDRRTGSDGSPCFVMVANNAVEIGRSEMYSSSAAVENGIASVKANAPDAEVADANA